MRKILFISLFLNMLLFSCDLSNPNNTVLVNNSIDKTVIVKLIGIDDIVIIPGQTIEIETLTRMNPSSRLQSYSPDRRVFYEYKNSSLTFEFYDRDSYEVRILNLTGKAGRLTASGWMDTINFTNSNTEQMNTNWLLYTKNPEFTAITTDGYPLQVLFLFTNNIFKVTIGG